MKSLNVVGEVKFPKPVSSDNAAHNHRSNILQETVLIVCTVHCTVSASLPIMLHIRNSLLTTHSQLTTRRHYTVKFNE